MKTDELREKYLAFFESKGHTRRGSDVLVPTWDPSVLFTPAGMNQFKDHFLGKVKLEFTRATTCQKCLRTGDIENVGRTAYHHTFFEMLGNFSFGDYFKREAIEWAWQFCTDKKWLGIDPARLTVSVYLDDDEAANIWTEEVGLPTSRIERMGEGDNFWPANAPSEGPDGVCGPCSEIFYRDNFGETVEIWNLVFTQFNRVGDPPNNLRPLPSRNIDTGMGLERTAATLQGVPTNYHIDILRPLVEAAAEACRCAVRSAGREWTAVSTHRRPYPRLHVCGARERVSGSQGREVCHSPPVATRGAGRPSAGCGRAVSVPARAGRRRDDGPSVSGTARHGGPRGAGHPARGAVLLRHH